MVGSRISSECRHISRQMMDTREEEQKIPLPTALERVKPRDDSNCGQERPAPRKPGALVSRPQAWPRGSRFAAPRAPGARAHPSHERGVVFLLLSFPTVNTWSPPGPGSERGVRTRLPRGRSAPHKPPPPGRPHCPACPSFKGLCPPTPETRGNRGAPGVWWESPSLSLLCFPFPRLSPHTLSRMNRGTSAPHSRSRAGLLCGVAFNLQMDLEENYIFSTFGPLLGTPRNSPLLFAAFLCKPGCGGHRVCRRVPAWDGPIPAEHPPGPPRPHSGPLSALLVPGLGRR